MLRLVLQLSEVEMKFLLAHFIVVPLIIFTVPPPKGMKADGASSHCKELYQSNPDFNQDYYNVTTDKTEKKRVFCTPKCGDTEGGWMRVGYVDAKMGDYNCSKWNLTYTVENLTCYTGDRKRQTCTELPKAMCTRGRLRPEDKGCFSIKFPTFGISYNKVCGRARGYQYGFTRAFHSYQYAGQRTLDDSYVSGLSVTHGEPGNRSHIWTFAAGFSQAYGYATVNCPHALYPGPAAPPFVGNNYTCESGNHKNVRRKWYLIDKVTNALWDCTKKTIDCRDRWFTTDVEEVEDDTDYIEVRMCHYPPYTRIEDIGVDELEIYIY